MIDFVYKKREGTTMQLVMGILIVCYAAGMALYVRPVERESRVSLALCVGTGIVSLLSAPAVTPGLGLLLVLMQVFIASVCGRLLYLELCERREQAKRQRREHSTTNGEKPSKALQNRRIAG